jgi:hypothetical protein
MATGVRARPANIQRDEEIQMTPVPGGEITSTQTWSEVPAESVVEEAIEEELPSEPDTIQED